jgi:hypothetical protein
LTGNHWYRGGGLETKGNIHRQEQRESCHGNQTEVGRRREQHQSCHGEQTEVGEAEDAEIDWQLELLVLRHCLSGEMEVAEMEQG